MTDRKAGLHVSTNNFGGNHTPAWFVNSLQESQEIGLKNSTFLWISGGWILKCLDSIKDWAIGLWFPGQHFVKLSLTKLSGSMVGQVKNLDFLYNGISCTAWSPLESRTGHFISIGHSVAEMLKCQCPGNQQLWQQSFFYFSSFF